MNQHNVRLLNPGSVVRGHNNGKIRRSFEFAAILAKQCHGPKPLLLCRPDAFNNVERIAACGNTNKNVARSAERFNLAGENYFKILNVVTWLKKRGVGREGDGGIGFSFEFIPTHQLRGKMLSIGGAAAVSRDQNFAAAFKAPAKRHDNIADRL